MNLGTAIRCAHLIDSEIDGKVIGSGFDADSVSFIGVVCCFLNGRIIIWNSNSLWLRFYYPSF